MIVLETEAEIGTQTSSRNSEVIHSGIYYAPGSLKAEFCVEGRASMTRFCEEHEVPVRTCGKLIIATNEGELRRLQSLMERGNANRVEGLQLVEPEKIKEIEPHVEAVRGLWAPKTGIVDYTKVAAAYVQRIRESGGEIRFNSRLRNVRRMGAKTVLETASGAYETSYVINCGGLHSDLIAAMMGVESDIRIVPFRGEYFIATFPPPLSVALTSFSSSCQRIYTRLSPGR